MSRDFFINGEALVSVKGPSNSTIGVSTQLGLSTDAIQVSIEEKYLGLKVDAFGGEHGPDVDVQTMLGEATIRMRLIHFDPLVLDTCLNLSTGQSTGGALLNGYFPRAGQRIGNNQARFAPGNNFISLNITSPVGLKPHRFYWTYIYGQPVAWPLGAERSIVELTWRAIPYTQDPWGGVTGGVAGGGASLGNAILYDYGVDT